MTSGKVFLSIIKVLAFLGGRLLDLGMILVGGVIGGILYMAIAHAVGSLQVTQSPCTVSAQVYNHETGELCPTENTQ